VWWIILIIIFPFLLFALIIHEYAHAKVAFWRGDPTAYYEGRLTLNPFVHFDLLGGGILFLTLVFSAFTRCFGYPFVCFGWAKPVPIDEEIFQKPRLDRAIVALAGPVSNFLLALAGAILFRINKLFFEVPLDGLNVFLYLWVNVNLVLSFFNLLPLPPLDGAKILASFLPGELAERLLVPSSYILVTSIILILIIVNTSWFNLLLQAGMNIFLGG